MPFLLTRLRVPLTWPEIFKRALYEAFWKDNCLALAAQLAYYFFFALFPTLLFMVALASYFPLTTLIDDLFRTMGGFMPPEVLQLITDQMIKISNDGQGGLLTLGVLLAVSSSSAAMVAIIDTLNKAYDVEEGRPWWKVRLTAMALTVSVATFILVSFALVLVGPTLATALAETMNLGPAFEWSWNEGKTTTACNIAMALAYGGARVLLIDADMRRPGLHRPLRLTNERGLSQILTGQARVRDVIQRTVDPNLLAITAGRTPPNPSELLASERMKTLLTNLAHGPFDWIVIDTPPVLAVTDAVILAPAVAGVTFVVGAEMTRRRLAERALETILASHPKMVGVVLNKVDFAKNKYYYSRYYGHQYKNYYAEAG